MRAGTEETVTRRALKIRRCDWTCHRCTQEKPGDSGGFCNLHQIQDRCCRLAFVGRASECGRVTFPSPARPLSISWGLPATSVLRTLCKDVRESMERSAL